MIFLCLVFATASRRSSMDMLNKDRRRDLVLFWIFRHSLVVSESYCPSDLSPNLRPGDWLVMSTYHPLSQRVYF